MWSARNRIKRQAFFLFFFLFLLGVDQFYFLGKIATNLFQIEKFCGYLNRNFFTSLHESTLKCIYICRVSTVPICIYCFIWNSHLGGMKISNGFQMDWVIHFHKIKSTKGCELFNNNTFLKMDVPFHILRCAQMPSHFSMKSTY